MRMIKITTCGGSEAWLNADAVESVFHNHLATDGHVEVVMRSGDRFTVPKDSAEHLLDALSGAAGTDAVPPAPAEDEAVPRGDREPVRPCLSDDQLAAVMRSQGFMPCENKPGHWFWPPDDRITAFPTAATNTALISGSSVVGSERPRLYHAVFRLPDGSKAERLNVHLSKLCTTLMSANVEWRPDP